jgi:hypothetical protein
MKRPIIGALATPVVAARKPHQSQANSMVERPHLNVATSGRSAF